MKRILGIALRIVLLVVVVAVLVLGGLALIMKKKQSLAQAPRYEAPAALVDTVPVERGNLNEVHEYWAVVAPVESAGITARVTATVEQVTVDEGDTVEPGQILVILDHRQTDAQLEGVQAQINQAQAELQGNRAAVSALRESLDYWRREADRDAQLVKKETISQSQAEGTYEKKTDVEGKLAAASQQSVAIEEQRRALEARLDELRTTLSYCNIQSPFAGVVTSRMVDPGDQAAPGKTLLTIESAGTMMITFDVPQTDLSAVSIGTPVSFRIGAQTHNAVLSRLYPSLNRARMARAEVILDADQAAALTSGEYLTISLAFEQHKDVPLVPVAALVEGADGNGEVRVFIVRNGILEARQVRVLGTACEQAAVDGVEADEQIVVSSFLGWARLADGMTVEARQ